MTTNQERYSNTAIILHWLMAILLITLFGLGWYMVDLPKGSDERSWFFALHKSIGLTMALLAFIRVVWRFTHTPPELPETVAKFKKNLAGLIHWLLYMAMIIQPLSGYISSSFSGYKTKIWGVPLPHWGWKSPELNELFTDIHVASSVALLCLVIVHLSGVAVHIYEGDKQILRRMMPGKK
jgi:cytochrome b561